MIILKSFNSLGFVCLDLLDSYRNLSEFYKKYLEG